MRSPSSLSLPAVGHGNDLFLNGYHGTSPHDELDSSSSWLIDDGHHLFGLPLEDEEGAFLETPPSSQEPDIMPDVSHTPFDELPVVQLSPSRPGDVEISTDGNGLDVLGDSRNLQMQERSYGFRNLSDGSHSIIWLARLNGNIARHVEDVSLYLTQPEEMQATCYDETTINPLAPVLRSTLEFLTFLQALRALSSPSSQPPSRERMVPASGSRFSPPLPSARPEAFSPLTALGIPTILMLLAGHLQLIQLYDAIFALTRESLPEMPYEQLAAFQPIPDLQLAGFPITQGHLQIKIMFQVIRHYLQQIERSMGLPPEYRIFRREDSQQGILSNLESPVLLQAIMEQVNGVQRGPGMSHLSSLKDNIQKVDEILQSY